MKQNRIKIIGAVLAILALSFNSCYDNKMEWDDPYTHPDAKDLPLALQEAISRYDVLKAYTDMRLGVGMDFGLYSTTEAYRNLVNQNFTDITPGNEMKQGSLMNSKGALDFTTADKLIDQMSKAGLTVYGHCLVWRSQQQASYLNDLIKPTIIPGSPGSSLIDGSFENGMGDWSAAYYKENYSIVSTDAIDGTNSLQVIIPSDATGGKYDGHGQLNSPNFPIINGHHYQLSFWIKGSAPGQVAIDFPNGNLGNQYPWVNGAEYAPVGTIWTQVIYNNATVGDAAMIATTDADDMHVRLLLAATPDVTYLIDGVEIVDLDAAPTGVNLITDGGFEAGTIGSLPDGWVSNNLSGGIEVSNEDAHSGSQSVKMVSDANTTTNYKLQLVSPSITVDPSKTYTFSFFIKSDVEGKGRISFPGQLNVGGAGNEYPWLDWLGTGSATEAFTTNPGQWTWISLDIQPQTTSLGFSFDMGYNANVTYYLDDVSLIEKTESASASKKPTTMRSGPVTIEKTADEKAAILEPVLVNYITDVVSHFKGKVHAWDVVNEPMTDTGALDVGTEDLTQTSTFYWAYYLGKDYAVTAFKTARAADPNAKLFINDYNLESTDGAKLNGLIEYVKYIESKGAQVDGIGTQMHLNINYTDSVGVENMFKKLGATGKLIKITELDICIDKGSGTSNPPASMISPTVDQYAQQASIYRYVVEMYKKYIPADKQYGITIWSVTDGDTWRTNDAPCLWDATYARKNAYKGFADGLAGKDVSADFSGDLVH